MTINIPVPIIKNWKTTAFGAISLILGIVQASGDGNVGTILHDGKVQMAILVALLGFFAKDHNVTGGNVGVPSTPQALAEANQAPAPNAIFPDKNASKLIS